MLVVLGGPFMGRSCDHLIKESINLGNLRFELLLILHINADLET